MRFSAVPLTFAFLASTAAAQCFDGNLGTALGLTTPLTGDVQLPMQALGFAFPLGGVTYTHIHITDKGYAWLSNNNVPLPPAGVDFDATAVELATGGPRIAPLWSDLQVIGTAGGEIWLNTSVPGRAVITWDNINCFGAACGAFDMQMQLLATGEVFFVFGPGATNNSTWSTAAEAGVSGIAPAGGALGSLSDLSFGGFTANNVVVEEWLAAMTFDMAGRGLHFVPTNPGWVFQAPTGCAAASTYGTGCVSAPDSIYEQWLGGFDLNNTTVTWLRTGSGYAVTTAIPGAFVPPTASATNVAALSLDGAQTFTVSPAMPAPGGPVSGISITTKGQIVLTAVTPTTIDFSPSPSELLADPDTQFVLWHDYDQTAVGSGLILFEQVGTTAYATWNGVQSYSSPAASTFQFQLNLATGDVTLVIQTMGGFANPDAGVLGFSVGGASVDPGPTDLSALTGVVNLADAGATGLALAASGQPQIGNSTFGLVTSNVPSLVPLGIEFFGTTVVNPGLDLTFLGMAGCFAYTDATLGSVTFPVAAGTGSVSLPIPNNAALVGTQLTVQSVAFTTATAFGLATSNGLLVLIGN